VAHARANGPRRRAGAATRCAATARGAAASTFSKRRRALAAIRADIGDCTRCKLHTLGRTQVVFGVGNPTPT
jgi:hypothetical protein